MYNSAKQNAQQFGVDGNPGVGCHFPWESASSGFDVSSDPCLLNDTLCNLRKVYVTAGVSYAIRQYYSMTRDRDYMINPVYLGCDVSRDIAKFLANLAVYNPVRARYDINGNSSISCFRYKVHYFIYSLKLKFMRLSNYMF